MAVASNGKAGKPNKVVKPQKSTKYSTAHTRNHRFVPFTERISKLKIDPIRRRRNVNDVEELDTTQETATYFGRSLAEWLDLNLSQTFTSFTKDVSPLCDSLAVLLYNEEKVMDLLMNYIERGDALAMEPLLSLLAHFAHDLDSRFEKHFERAVSTVAAVAAKHQDPAVVEWSFTCLAWLFKYLSRLLTPDLRPLYNLMSPYLGKESQKPFIVRFAAESLSFLLRKTASVYDRDREPLDRIIAHIVDDCQTADSLHSQGVMTLLTEAIKGIQHSIHSAGTVILQSLLRHVAARLSDETNALSDLACGVIISLIHFTTAETFAPVQETILGFIEGADPSDSKLVQFCALLEFTIASVRQGSRITNWTRMVQSLKGFIERGTWTDDWAVATRKAILSAAATVLQAATVDAVLPALGIFTTLSTASWQPQFLQFCDLFARLGLERFQQFLLPVFQRFLSAILDKTGPNQEEGLLALQRLGASGIDVQIRAPATLETRILSIVRAADKVQRNEKHLEELTTANDALMALKHLKVSQEFQDDLGEVLHSAVKTSLSADHVNEGSVFALGLAFEKLLDSQAMSADAVELFDGICNVSTQFYTMEKFWSNVLRYLKSYPPSLSIEADSKVQSLQSSLQKALTLPSHSIREAALDIIRQLYLARGVDVPELLDIAIAIESTPINLETSRGISLNMRRLTAAYQDAPMNDFMLQAIPSLCFGLLHVQFTSVWDDAIKALADMSKRDEADRIIVSIAGSWLDGVTDGNDTLGKELVDPLVGMETQVPRVTSDFECSHLAKITAISSQVFGSEQSGHPTSEAIFQRQHIRVPPVSAIAREQALRILTKLPSLAEKRSRMLIPVLLRWAGNSSELDLDEADGSSLRWSRKDQKAMLNIVSQFNNPRVLYKSGEVYDALLNLCSNGDVEIQHSALKAVFAWKEEAVTRYAEHLTNLLDEARFRDEVAVFLQSGDEDITVRTEDYSRLMPVLLRLLYGRAVAGGKQGQSPRRKAVFVALSNFGSDVLGMFIDVALRKASSESRGIDCSRMPLRQQLGMLNLVHDLWETLGSQLDPHASKLMEATLSCTIKAANQLDALDAADGLQDGSLLRAVRQTGVQCLSDVYAHATTADYTREAELIVKDLITPRLNKFANENSQSVSGILRLLATWSSGDNTVAFLVRLNSEIPAKLSELLASPSTRKEVQLHLLQEIFDNLLKRNNFLEKDVIVLVKSIGQTLNQAPAKDVLDACVSTFTLLARNITTAPEAQDIIQVCTRLLTKPNREVSPWTKTSLLKTLLPLIENFEITIDTVLYEAVSALFSRLRDGSSRALLSQVLVKLCKGDELLRDSAIVCEDMNSVGKSLDEADHERRERGFTKLYKHGEKYNVQQWLPIVHNCLFFIRDADDLVNRASASQGLEKFLQVAGNSPDTFKPTISSVFIPGFEYGVKESSELVRAEYARLLGCLVSALPQWQAVSDMSVLTVEGDDEASFFSNVLHIQQHRRLRALRRLAESASQLSSANVLRFLLPMLEHFIFDQASGDAGRTLADQTIVTIGCLADVMTWSAFRSTFKRYVKSLTAKDNEDLEKAIMRLLGTLVDSLVRKYGSDVDEQGQSVSKSKVIVDEFLPPLTQYIHHKDESTVDRRLPVAVTVVRLMTLLPSEEMTLRLAPVLTDVCHVLRSRSQEARDQTRKTLVSMLSIVGPAYLGFMLKELRTSLQRGYQLHVMAFTVHSLLVHSIETTRPGDLNYCLSDLMGVIMDDIFGATGLEKDAEEYKTTTKEIKANKSYDSLELLAKVTPVKLIGQLVKPMQALLAEKLDSKTLKKLDELLTRLRKGIDQNPSADTRDMLVLCHEIIRQVYAEQKAAAVPKPKERAVNRYIMQMESANKSKARGATTNQQLKLAAFALNLLRKLLRRHDDLKTPANLAGFLPITGDALVQGHEEVRISAIRLLSTIMGVALPELDENAAVYVKEAVAIIKGASSTTSDSSKAALELLTSVLRERRSVSVKERDIGQVLKALKPDIDEPDRQGVIYKFLRAVLGRKVLATEVYEVMDEVSKVVVTNADRNVRESARSAYLQFIVDYPQGKDRWTKQAAFFVENLKYKSPAGRQSIMELLNQLLGKLGDEVLEQLAFTLFVALVPVQVSDSELACRQMAGLLIGKLFERASDEQLATYLKLLDKWAHNEANDMIRIAALQCWIVLLRTRKPSDKQVKSIRDDIRSLLESTTHDEKLIGNALHLFSVFVESLPEFGFASQANDIWLALRRYTSKSEAEAGITATALLSILFDHLASSSAKDGSGLSVVPLKGSGGLQLEAQDLRHICTSSLRTFRTASYETDDALLASTSRNLVFLGRCFAANGMLWRTETTEGHDSSSDVEDVEGDGTAKQQDPSALAYLLNRLSYIIRQDRLTVKARTAALQTQALLLPQLTIVPNAASLIRPLYLLTDPTIPQPPGDSHKALSDRARELLDAVQSKVGGEAFMAALAEVRKEAKERREERRTKRRIEAVSQPEKWAQDKKKKYEVKKAKKKVKGEDARGKRRGW